MLDRQPARQTDRYLAQLLIDDTKLEGVVHLMFIIVHNELRSLWTDRSTHRQTDGQTERQTESVTKKQADPLPSSC